MDKASVYRTGSLFLDSTTFLVFCYLSRIEGSPRALREPPHSFCATPLVKDYQLSYNANVLPLLQHALTGEPVY